MKIHIIRHADPDYANDTITAAGHLEAKALARRMEKMGIDEIYHSPVPRAVYTMEYTAKLTGLEPVVLPWTAELDWRVEGRDGELRSAWNTDGEWVREKRPFPNQDNWHQFGPFAKQDFAIKYKEMQQNSDHFLASLGYKREEGVYRMTDANRKQIAVFCHLGFGITWLSHLLELPLPLVWSGFYMRPSAVTTILMDERSEQFSVPRCLQWGDTSHLYEAGLPLSTQGIIANTD